LSPAEVRRLHRKSKTAKPNASTPNAATPQCSALLVMVHGSPRPIANTEMFHVVEVIRQREVFPIVEVGFMECNEPTIPDAIEACVAQGRRRFWPCPIFSYRKRTSPRTADPAGRRARAPSRGRVSHGSVSGPLGTIDRSAGKADSRKNRDCSLKG